MGCTKGFAVMHRLAALLLTGVVAFAHAGALAPVESQKIEYLIAAIETLNDVQFVRNGTAYSAKAAADHLRLKLENAGSRVRSAEDFIRYCASVSSVSGTPYQIRFSGGRVVMSEAYLREKLSGFRASADDQPSRQ
jgi:hypothetical protein